MRLRNVQRCGSYLSNLWNSNCRAFRKLYFSECKKTKFQSLKFSLLSDHLLTNDFQPPRYLVRLVCIPKNTLSSDLKFYCRSVLWAKKNGELNFLFFEMSLNRGDNNLWKLLNWTIDKVLFCLQEWQTLLDQWQSFLFVFLIEDWDRSNFWSLNFCLIKNQSLWRNFISIGCFLFSVIYLLLWA